MNRRLYPLKGTSFDRVYVVFGARVDLGFFAIRQKRIRGGSTYAECNSVSLKEHLPLGRPRHCLTATPGSARHHGPTPFNSPTSHAVCIERGEGEGWEGGDGTGRDGSGGEGRGGEGRGGDGKGRDGRGGEGRGGEGGEGTGREGRGGEGEGRGGEGREGEGTGREGRGRRLEGRGGEGKDIGGGEGREEEERGGGKLHRRYPDEGTGHGPVYSIFTNHPTTRPLPLRLWYYK